jgi:hypothetical protein
LIPSELINIENDDLLSKNLNTEKSVKAKIKNFTLALEQILILLHNPEYNVLKVAGSP